MLRITSDLPFSKDSLSWFLPCMVTLMVFFASLTMTGTLCLNSMMSKWSNSISGSLTVQVMPTEENGTINKKETQKETEQVLDILRKTEGIYSAYVLTDNQMKKLLKPWLGDSFLLDDLPLPKLIDVQLISDTHVDMDALRKVLEKRTPNATLDIHKIWLGKLFKIVKALDLLSSSLLILVIASTSIIVIYVTSASLAVHKPVIEILHQTGAYDYYIAKQYAKRTAFLASLGAVLGFGLVIPILSKISDLGHDIQGGLLAAAKFDTSSWLILSSIPILAIFLATTTAFWTVTRALRKLL